MRHLPAANLLVDAPLIDEVRDIQTGALIPAHALVTDDYEGVLRLRMSLMQSVRSGQAQYVCPVCSRPLHLVSRPTERRFFFRHFRSDDECPLQAERGLSGEQILAMKYDGARESAAHIRMKNIIAESLRCDPDFSEVQIEAIWKGTEANSRRKPDVRAIWRNSIPVAFEVQLSTPSLG